jgi:hypothetical protein
MLPDGVKGDTAPLVVERWYDFPEFGGYLGNVGYTNRLQHLPPELVTW